MELWNCGTVEMDSGSGTVEMHVEVELWKCNLWKWSARTGRRRDKDLVLFCLFFEKQRGTLGNTKDSARPFRE